MRGQLEHAVRAVGAEASFGRDAAYVQHPGGTVRRTLPLDRHDSRDLIGMASTACLIVIAAISRMRASEPMELTVSSPALLGDDTPEIALLFGLQLPVPLPGIPLLGERHTTQAPAAQHRLKLLSAIERLLIGTACSTMACVLAGGSSCSQHASAPR
jgi:hypothetical protein